MGRITRILSFFRSVRDGAFLSQTRSKSTRSVIYTSDNFQSSGEDSQPLPGDFAITVETVRTGSSAVVGYIDQKNEGVSEPGEKRIYSRDSSGNVIATLYLKNNGEIEIKNDELSMHLFNSGDVLIQNENITLAMSPAGAFKLDNTLGILELRDDGSIDLNGTIIDPTGAISTNSIEVDGKQLKDHTHGGVTVGGGTTGPNI